jgi:hypothetical protein
MMKRYLGRAAAVVLALLAVYALWRWGNQPTELRLYDEPFTAVSTDCPEGLSLEVKSAYPGAVNLQVTNDTGREYWTLGKQFDLQYGGDGIWYGVHWKEGVNTTSELVARKLETREETLNVLAFYGRLPQGHYRVITGVYPDMDSALEAYDGGGAPDFYLTAEFTIR